ncbi:hypothetical protein TREES_T100009664 [Tupaia chinensis]|uniref:Uncharacterized protein n=1 Tax=Tupaia chinensis TaxID=246437 RepID=L9LC47_TUPCH|nr:hypothetical protein TREES_T100009664 [Tupaia chinensis]
MSELSTRSGSERAGSARCRVSLRVFYLGFFEWTVTSRSLGEPAEHEGGSAVPVHPGTRCSRQMGEHARAMACAELGPKDRTAMCVKPHEAPAQLLNDGHISSGPHRNDHRQYYQLPHAVHAPYHPLPFLHLHTTASTAPSWSQHGTRFLLTSPHEGQGSPATWTALLPMDEGRGSKVE